MKQMIYLDGLMSAPLEKEVLSAMLPFFEEHYGNASSGHSGGLFLREALENARKEIASFIGATDPNCIYFTSGATESANLALTGLMRQAHHSGENHCIVGAIEHPSVLETARALQREGIQITELPVNSSGEYDIKKLKRFLKKETALVALAHSNHDLGTIQNISELADIAHEAGALFYSDATTSFGWSHLNVTDLNIDLLSFSFHRMGGPLGVGALYIKPGIESKLDPILHGGVQENGLRPGTLNIPAIVGAAKACEERLKNWDSVLQKTSSLQKMLYEFICQKIEHVKLNGAPLGSGRLPHHLSLSFQRVDAETLMLRLDLQGVQLHAGTGCVTRSLKVPYTLKAIGLNPDAALSTLLIGLHPHLTEESIETAASKIADSVQKLRALQNFIPKG